MRKKPISVQRAALKLLCTLLGIILVLMLSVTLLFRHMLGKIHYVDQEDFPTLSQEELDAYLATEYLYYDEEAAPAMAPEEISFDEHTTQIGGKDSKLINILLIGQDRRPGEGRARSDSMILWSLNKKDRQITMTSILRDLYVQIPGYQANRINAAYAAGGMPLLKSTLKKNFGIHVDGCIEVDFTQFSQIVDLLGGVPIVLRQDEADSINRTVPGNLTEGKQWLSGSQALAYARIRNLDSDGDFSRTNRQRKVVGALLDSYRGSSLSSLLSVVSDALPMISTDMEDSQIVTLTLELFPLLSDTEIVSQRIPADGTYTDRTIRDMSVLVADMDATRRMLMQTLLGISE